MPLTAPCHHVEEQSVLFLPFPLYANGSLVMTTVTLPRLTCTTPLVRSVRGVRRDRRRMSCRAIGHP